MNQKQLLAAKESGTTVALSAYGRDTDNAYEVRVIDTKAPRRVYSGARWDFSGHKSTGVQVEYVNGGKTEVVAPSKIFATWAEYLVAQEKRNEQKQSQEQRTAASKATAEAAAAKLAQRYTEAVGTEPTYGMIEVVGNGARYGNTWYPTTAYSVKVETRVLLAVLSDAPAVRDAR